MVCANVNESFMQLVENCSSTGCKMLASHLAKSFNTVNSFQILKRCHTEHETKIQEAVLIKKLNPMLNKQLYVKSRGGVEDTRLEAKDTKKIRGQGQGQHFRGQTLSRPRTEMLEAKAKDQGHRCKCSPKKKKKIFKRVFQALSNL